MTARDVPLPNSAAIRQQPMSASARRAKLDALHSEPHHLRLGDVVLIETEDGYMRAALVATAPDDTSVVATFARVRVQKSGAKEDEDGLADVD